ncbi:Omp85 family outer membrane protein [Melittangium boletus]|uniref:Membrane protein n=1 Tax=Melittangium boletus DSM 14713 TaxID=1294270 RepID=A0A250IQ40_9BACT|nr:BamA/TamA family outer membrane protein [Melittangium boletus]ATB33056.1 membrane protein [Melittangium boletus DSM 14713]
MSPIRTTWAAVMWGVLATSAGAQTPPPPEPVPPREVEAPPIAEASLVRTGWSVQGLPLLNYNSDEGLGYGARLMLVDRGDGTDRPYRMAIVAQFFQTTRGVATHRLFLDAPRVFSSSWRLGVSVGLLNDRFSPYFGLGEQAEYTPAFAACEDRAALKSEPDVCPGNPDFRGLRYYTFDQRTLPSIMVNGRRPLSGPWQLVLGYRFRLTTVRTRYGADDLGQARQSRLEEDVRAGRLVGLGDNPSGPTLVRTGELNAGLILDLRDNEPAPVRGMFHELALRGASPGTGSAFTYGGASLNLRFYYPLFTERLVAALRLFGDVVAGDVPFPLLSTFTGIEWREGFGGIGGVYSARGILKNRLQGQAKLLGNGELRWKFLAVEPGGQRLDFTLIAFLDGGKAWEDPRFQNGSPALYGGGGGLRIAWDENFIVRADYGVSPRDGTTGFYLDFNHLF